jgi:hypothetical protein
MAITGRCMRCKANDMEMADVKMTKTARGGFMAKGKCKKCGCGMCKIRSAADAEKDIKNGDAEKAY